VFEPVVAMFALTFIVWLYMYVQRFRYIAVNKIKPQQIATPEAVTTLLPEWVNRPSDNLKNLFELPVIFYAACTLAISTHANDQWFISMAWSFVALRAVHSAIHCTINHVIVRFLTYLMSSIVLFGMVIRLAVVLS
jgi:hypothetical protein